MRKMKFLTIAAAMFAASTTLTSCWSSDDDPAGKSAKISDLVAETYTIVATSNAEVVFTIDAPATRELSADKKSAIFSEIKGDKVNVTATLVKAGGYVTTTQTATVDLSKENPNVAISFDFAKRSTETVSQAAAAASTTDITVTSNLSTLDAALTIPAHTLITAGTSDEDFSVTAYKAPADVIDKDELKVGDELSVKTMVLDCTPNGSEFSDDVKLTLYAGQEFAGRRLTIENNGEKVSSIVREDGYVSWEVKHFSDWTLIIKLISDGWVDGKETLLSTTVNAKAGDNEFKYLKNVGVVIPYTGIFALILNNTLGAFSTTVEDVVSFKSDADATVRVDIVQNYTEFAFEISDDLFIQQPIRIAARKWGNVTATVTVPSGESHSGGASADL